MRSIAKRRVLLGVFAGLAGVVGLANAGWAWHSSQPIFYGTSVGMAFLVAAMVVLIRQDR